MLNTPLTRGTVMVAYHELAASDMPRGLSRDQVLHESQHILSVDVERSGTIDEQPILLTQSTAPENIARIR